MANVLCVSHEWNLGFDELREMSNAGFRVIPTRNGYDAVRQYASREIDAVIVNRWLPDIEVADLLSYIRHHNETIPIVMLSSIMPVPAIPAMVDAVIQKSSGAGLLVPTLQLLLRSRASDEIAGGDSVAQAA